MAWRFSGDIPIAEHLRQALEHLPFHHFKDDAQIRNVQGFLKELITTTRRYNASKAELGNSFPWGNYESNEVGWRWVIREGLLDWDGSRFVLSQKLSPGEERV